MTGQMQMPTKLMWGPMWLPAGRPDLHRLLEWHPQPIPVLPLLCLLLMIGYGAGVVQMHRTGHPWPIRRTVSWVFGLATVVSVTGTGAGGYGMGMFSVHMVQHMMLSMFSPILLLIGRPVTLALRALPSGHGRRGRVRRALLVVLHSRFAQVISAPALTIPLFILTFYGLYFTPLFDWAMGNWFGHTAMLLHFLMVGMLLFWPILALDPSPHHASAPVRLLELMVPTPFHAFFGITVMASTSLVARFFAHPPMAWHVHPLADQNMAGGIAWAFSEIPIVVVLITVFVQWRLTSAREAARYDRNEERTGDKSLNDYNAWLAGIAAHGGVRPRPDAEPPEVDAGEPVHST